MIIVNLAQDSDNCKYHVLFINTIGIQDMQLIGHRKNVYCCNIPRFFWYIIRKKIVVCINREHSITLTLQYPLHLIYTSFSIKVVKENKIKFTCSNHVNLLTIFNFRLITHFFFFAGKTIAWKAVQAITSATGTRPEKNELNQQKLIAIMKIWKKNYNICIFTSPVVIEDSNSL